MNTRERLRRLKEIERRNAQRLKAWKDAQRRKQEATDKAERKEVKKEHGP